MNIAVQLLAELLGLQQRSPQCVILAIQDLLQFKKQHKTCRTVYSDLINQIAKSRVLLQTKLNEQIRATIQKETPHLTIKQRIIKLQQSETSSLDKTNQLNKKLKYSRAVYSIMHIPAIEKSQQKFKKSQNTYEQTDILKEQKEMYFRENLLLQHENRKLRALLQQKKSKQLYT